MADNEENGSSAEQTAKIAEFQELTGLEDTDACKLKLEQHGWDMERAVQDAFNELEGRANVYNYHEPPPPPPPVARAPEIRRRVVTNRPVTIHHDRFQRRIVQGRRPVRTADHMTWSQWGSQVLLLPYHLVKSVITTIWDVLNFFFTLIRPDPRIQNLDPLGDVENFISLYESKYGDSHPTFFHGTYTQALNEGKQELKFVLVYLHGDDHHHTDEFCAQVLSQESLIQYINANFILWGCNINSGEGYKASLSLKENTYPFLAVIVLKQNRMTVVARIEGLIGADELLDNLMRIKEDNEVNLITARLDREERSMNRSIREEQDAAYLESARLDREKAKKKQEDLERKRREEEQLVEEQRARDEQAAMIIAMKEEWRKEIPEEPPADHPDCVRILIKLPSSTRLERRFLKTHSTKYLYYFVSCHEEAPDNFDIATNFPRRTLPCKPESDNSKDPPTFEELNISRSEMLFVYDHDA